MKILIVEDERIAARRLERMLKEFYPDAHIDVRETLATSREALEAGAIDVLFLDLNLHGEDGFRLLSEVTSYPFQTVVVSANTDRALTAFEYGVLDFIPKPFDRSRLEKAVARIDQMGQNEDLPAEESLKQLAVKRFGVLAIIPLSDILYFKGAGDYVELVLRNGDTELYSKSLEALEKLLGANYKRVHKSYIVDLAEMKQVLVHGGGKYEIELKSGGTIPLSRTKYKEIQQQAL